MEVGTMLKSLTTVNVWVRDQHEALAFYTEKLGLELRNDTTLPEMGNFRWLTVGVPGQKDVAIVLMAVPGPPVFDEETSSKLKDLVAKGAAGGLFFTIDDIDGTYSELKGRAARFPRSRPTSRKGATPVSATRPGIRCGWPSSATSRVPRHPRRRDRAEPSRDADLRGRGVRLRRVLLPRLQPARRGPRPAPPPVLQDLDCAER